jgi:hypothetical protein
MMSLCDVIFHICSCLDIKIIENLLVHVIPYLIKLFNVMREDQSNSIFSLLGKNIEVSFSLECIQQVANLMGDKIEQFADEIISRCSGLVKWIIEAKESN